MAAEPGARVVTYDELAASGMTYDEIAAHRVYSQLPVVGHVAAQAAPAPMVGPEARPQ